jgi:hypothetical protein
MASPPPKSRIFIEFSRPQNGAALPSPGRFSQSEGRIGSNHCESDSRRVRGGGKSQQGRRGRGHCLWRAGGSNPLIFSTSRRTCICSVLFFDSSSEYPFAPFCHHCSRDFYSHVRVDVALAHQEEFGRLRSTTINMILLSF